MTDTCKHPQLQLLGGVLHPSGKDYQCLQCHEFLLVELHSQTIGVSLRNTLRRLCKCGHTLELHDDQAVCRAMVKDHKSCQCMQFDGA